MSYIITVQEGFGIDEQHVYFTDDPPEYCAIRDVDGNILNSIDVKFAPKNGRYPNRSMSVPLQRVLSVVAGA